MFKTIFWSWLTGAFIFWLFDVHPIDYTIGLVLISFVLLILLMCIIAYENHKEKKLLATMTELEQREYHRQKYLKAIDEAEKNKEKRKEEIRRKNEEIRRKNEVLILKELQPKKMSLSKKLVISGVAGYIIGKKIGKW